MPVRPSFLSFLPFPSFLSGLLFACLLLLLPAGMAAQGSADPAAALSSDIRLRLARAQVAKGEYDEALLQYRLYLSENPEDARVLRELDKVKALKSGREKTAAPAVHPPAGSKPPTGSKPPAAAEAPSPAPGPAAELLRKIIAGYQGDRPEEVLRLSRLLLQREPGHPGAYYYAGVVRYERGELRKAAYNLRRSLAYPDKGFNAHYYLGRIAHKEGDKPRALEHYRLYLAATSSEEGRKRVRDLLAQVEGPAAAEAASPQAAPPAQNPRSPGPSPVPAASKSDEAKALTPEASPLPAAADSAGLPGLLCREILPGSPFATLASGTAAARGLTRAFESARDRRYEKAVNTLKDLVRRYGGSPEAEAAAFDLGVVYLVMGLPDLALVHLEELEKSAGGPGPWGGAPAFLRAQASLGLAAARPGKEAERRAAEILADLEVVKTGPPCGPAPEDLRRLRIEAAERAGNEKKLLEMLEKTVTAATDPRDAAAAWGRIGAIRLRQKNPAAARQAWQKGVALCGDPAGLRGAASTGSGGSGAADSAGGTAGAADSASKSACAQSRMALADLDFREKRLQEALGGYRSWVAAFEKEAGADWAFYQIANIHRAEGRLEEALKGYQRVIDNHPYSYWAAQAKWRREDAIWRKEYGEALE